MKLTRATVIGLAWIFLAISLNPWTVQPFLTPDSLLNNSANAILLGGLDVAWLILGVAIITQGQAVWANRGPLLMSVTIFTGLFLLMDIALGYLDILADLDNNSHIQNVYEPDDYLGWKPIANSLGSHRTDQFEVQYQLDAQGFKTVDHKGPSRYHLYFFGDSYTFGHGVTNADTYPNLMAKNDLADDIQVHNAAVMGYGIVQMYARFLQTLPQIQPGDLVLFVPLSRDLERNTKDFMFTIQFIFSDSFVKVNHYPEYDQGVIKTVPLRTYYNEATALLFSARYSGRNFQFVYNQFFKPDTTQEAWEMLEQARRLTTAKGARFELIFLPRTTEVRRGQYEFDLSRFQFHDLMAYFPRHRDELKQLGFEGDSHWNPAGHRLAAAALVDKLVETGVLTAPDVKYQPLPLPAQDWGELRLLRAAIQPQTSTLQVRLTWEAQQTITQNYTLFVQLLDQQGRRLTGVDEQPPRSWSTVAPHERLITTHSLTWPDSPKPYHMLIGAYFVVGDKLVNIGTVTLPLP